MAKLAFERCAHDYARYRPSYPPQVAERVNRHAPPGPIADVGAGTGIFTRDLLATGRRVLAIDPSPAMLAEIAPEPGQPPADRMVASAERLGLKDGAMAGITCAQSFHWFNPPVALAEFARVLAPGGLLLLVWNNRDGADPFVTAFEALISRFNPAYCCEYRQQDWAGKIAASGSFGRAEEVAYRSVWQLGPEAFLGFTRSTSYIRNVLSVADRAAFEGEVRGLMERHFGGRDCAIPLVTRAWWCRRS